jgi:hypothetical protein
MNPLALDVYMVFGDESGEVVNADAPGVTKPGLPLSARPGHEVSSYRELLKKIAALSYHNSRFRLLFRGQTRDHVRPGGHSSLYPSIFRPSRSGDRRGELKARFAALRVAEELLKQGLSVRDVHRDQIVRWAILQHYEVVPTPLLDVTRSIQAALSFALAGESDEGYLFVLAFPHLTGPVSVSIESLTQVIDLSQVCPPAVLRPHFQEGLLVGDYPVVDNAESSHGGKGMIGNNFACRLLGKFRLTTCSRWANEGFLATRNDILFPAEDEWLPIVNAIKNKVRTQ